MKKYNASFTAGSLLFGETDKLINSFSDIRELLESDKSKINDLISTRSEIARMRIIREITKRIKSVNNYSLWNYYKKTEEKEKKIILYYACLRSYNLIQDFHLEVVLEKWKNFETNLEAQDFLNFLYRKQATHSEIADWTDKTHHKLAAVAILMLNQVGLLKDKKLKKIDISNDIWKFFVNIGEIWFLEAMFLSKSQIDDIIEY